MTSLIINLSFAVFHRQSLSCEVIDKSRATSILPTASIPLFALAGRFQLRYYCSKFPPPFSVCKLGRSIHFIPFVFEFLLFPSYDPYWQLLSCALPGWFQSSNHFSKLLPPFLVCESGHSVRSGSIFFETLVSTRTLHLKNSSCALPCLFQSVELF